MSKQILPICLTQLATAVIAGPRTPAATFLAEHVDTSVPALSGIPALLEAGDIAGAEKAFADHVRGNLRNEEVNAKWVKREYSPAELAKLKARAGKVMDYNLTSCGTTHHFADNKVVWEANPTPNQYREWTYQLNRHWDLSILAEYYLKTGDEKAAEVWVDMVDSWLDQAIVPEQGVGAHATKCWRTIDAGIRVRQWALQIAAFGGSPKVSDELLTRIFASVWEHGWRLRNNTTSGNWLLTELRGILTIAVLYPYLRDAPEWESFAIGRMEREFAVQVYPDGFQFELTTAYQGVSVNEYRGILDLYVDLGREPPRFIREGLERMYGVYPRLCRPRWVTPNINDGEYESVYMCCRKALELYPGRKDFRWFATLRKEGEQPEYLSYAFPYAGAIVFRDSWRPDAVWAYLDASPFGCGHQHEDKLNFVMDAYGRDMVVEGGNYFYDTSEMRKYVLSTRAHNTIRIDGHDQSQRRTYVWRPDDIRRKADFEFETTAGRDRARASYTAGYGPGGLKAVHDRTVLFFKDVEGLGPFFAIVDRLTAPDDRRHKYETLWHLAESGLTITNSTFTAEFSKGVGLFGAVSDAEASITDKKGMTKPELQGWVAVWKSDPKAQRAVPTPTVEGAFTGSRRIVTVLYPYRDGKCPVAGVRAAADPSETGFSIILADGAEIALDEKPLGAKNGLAEK